MKPHKVICRLSTGKIIKYEVDGVTNAEDARLFVKSQVRQATTILALVNNVYNPTLIKKTSDNDPPPKRYA